MKKTMLRAVLGFFILMCFTATLFAAEIDVLLEKLVEKGVLTPLEAQIIKDETVQSVAEQNAKQINDTTPEWVQKLKLKGDLRLRYQYESNSQTDTSRSRGRTRFRLGTEAQVSDQWKIAAGLATGSSDARSTNQTWDNFFETPEIRLDYAYGEFQPFSWLKMSGGRILNKDYLWRPTDLLWDSDVNPNGGSLALSHKLIGEIDGFVNAGAWIMDENGANKEPDPFIGYVQGGLQYNDGKFDAKVAGTYYSFTGIKGLDPDGSSDTNTRISGTNNLVHDYDSAGASVELGVANLLGGLPLFIDERIALFGDCITNGDPKDNAFGWAAGLSWGKAKVAGKGDWQMKYVYANLGKDAWVDFLPDSDRYGGRTDIKSHEVILEYGLSKNVFFGIDYYQSQRIVAAKRAETIVQADLNFKF